MTQLLADHQDMDATGPSRVQEVQCSWDELRLRLDRLPALLALHALSLVGRDLLRRTAELPDAEQGLLAVLTEYRYALHAFSGVAERLKDRHPLQDCIASPCRVDRSQD